MTLSFSPFIPSGNTRAIASKSDVHRLLICAALCKRPTTIKLDARAISKDIEATLRCVKFLGGSYEIAKDKIVINPARITPISPEFSCGESGSTLRFMIPVAAVKANNATFMGTGRLGERPIIDLLNALKQNGVKVSNDKLPFTLSGTLQSGTFTLPGNISSQYITGLLLALPLLFGDSKIELTSPLESAPYVDMTIDTLSCFGIKVETILDSNEVIGYKIPGNQKYVSPGTIDADGDWSNAAFFLSLAAINGSLNVVGLSEDSLQGDKAIIEILQRFGAEIKIRNDSIKVTAAPLTGCKIDLSQIPDLLPILAVVAACASGETHFYGAARLHFKESDRIHSVCKMITDLGGKATEGPDGLIVEHSPLLGGEVESFNDHRIVMATAVAASICTDNVILKDAQAVDKSYPNFFEDYSSIGGKAHVI